MRNLLFIAAILTLGLSQSFAQNAAPAAPTTTTVANPNAPVAKFDRTTADFGDIDQGIPKEAEFKLTNTGKEPLLIQTARAGCGCTNLRYSQEPILPGKFTIIAATYNAAAPGAFMKNITVTTNADPNPVVLYIKGTVIVKQQPAAEKQQ